MAAKTKIEWASETWNPLLGCDRVSLACDSCYAIPQARIREANPHPAVRAAFAGLVTKTDGRLDWTGQVNLLPERLTQPLRWKAPRRIFVNSLADMFHKEVPVAFIAKVLAVMALAPQHTFLMLTKRHARMRSVLRDECGCGNGHVPGVHLRSQMAWAVSAANPDRIPGMADDAEQRVWNAPWPLTNLHLGVSVESQQWADIRISALLDTPAAVRWISAEPLLGPVDLTRWMPPVSPVPLEQAPKTWADWQWPDWVPTPVRDAVEGFWGPRSYRQPAEYIRSMWQQGAPAFGSVVTLRDGFGSNAPLRTGRFVFAWGNIGRLVLKDGTFLYTSFHHGQERRRQQALNWVVAGGETGAKARPSHPDWFRSLRDQCAAADVPYFFKQHGDWAEMRTLHGDDRLDAWDDKRTRYVHPVDGRTQSHGDWGGQDHLEGWAIMQRVGKKTAGRLLDGRQHDDYPVVLA